MATMHYLGRPSNCTVKK